MFYDVQGKENQEEVEVRTRIPETDSHRGGTLESSEEQVIINDVNIWDERNQMVGDDWEVERKEPLTR